MASNGSDRKTIHRTTDDGDTVTVRDENGVIVVETKVHGRRQRQEITVPDGWSVEHARPERPRGGE